MAMRQEDTCWVLPDSAADIATTALTTPNTMALVLTAAVVTAGPALEALFFGSVPEFFLKNESRKKRTSSC